MGIFDSFIAPAPTKPQIKTEKRSYNPGWLQSITNYIMQGHTNAGTTINPVSEQEALTVDAVYSSVKLLSELTASLELKYEVLQEDSEYYAYKRNHRLAKTLRNPNDMQTGYIFMQSMLAKMLLRGNSWAFILRRGDQVQLLPIYDQVVETLVSPRGDEVFYKINQVTFAADEMLHFKTLTLDGVLGLSPIHYAYRTLRNAIDSEKYMNKVFDSGINASGFFITGERLSDKVYERLKKDIEEKSGIERAGEAQILEQGLKFERNTLSAADSKILENMAFTVEQICRIYRIPKHLLFLDSTAGSTQSFATQAQEFVTYSLQPLLTAIEAELEEKLLPKSQVDTGSVRVRFDTRTLLRVDPQQRVKYYQGLFQIGAITTNEARAQEGLPPIDGGETAFVQLNLAPIDQISDIIQDKINKQIDSTNG